MTTLRQIVTDALRESGIISVGGEPEAEEFDEGLRRLQALIKSTFGNELGDPLSTVNYGTYGLTNSFATGQDLRYEIDSVYAPNNTRLIFNTNSANTIFLSPNPNDGSRFAVIDNGGNFATYPLTINANGRKIETSGTVTLNTDSANSEWFYRADLANWQKVTDLIAGDEMPLPSEFDDFFITLMAVRLNPRYGAETASDTGEILRRFGRQFRARYRQTSPQNSEYGLIMLPSNQYGRWTNFSNFSNFSKGAP